MSRFKVIVFISCVAAFYGWLILAATTVALPTPTSPFLFYSNQTRHDLKLTLCTVIRSAKKSLHLSVYGVTDSDLIALLNKKAEEIPISLFYDKSASLDLKKHLNKKIDAKAAQGRGLMHRKLLIIDEAQVFVGSANLTLPSLHMHDNLIIGLYSPPLAQFLKNPSSSCFSFSGGELWLLPDKENRALERLIYLIENSKKSIKLTMFTLTHPHLTAALIQAKQRGVKISCAVDFYTARGASLKAIERLKAAGIKIHLSQGRQLLHHKWAWIDKKILIAGSANWTKAAFKTNQECFLILNPLSKSQKKLLCHLWNTIGLESN